jgi:hypothetical protein
MKTTFACLSKISEQEWRFDTVRDEELNLCFLYEYGREQAESSPRWHKLAKQVRALGGRKGSLRHRLQMFSIFGKAPRLFWFNMPDFVATPWQAVPEKLRREETKQFNEKRSKPQNFREAIALSMTLERDLHGWARAGATDYESWVLLDRCFHDETNQREYGFFALDWNYTDSHLIEEFKKWLVAKRGDRRPSESRQGKNKARQHLNALGAKRLLDSGFTVAQAMEYTQRFLKDEAGHSRPLYDSERGWSKAKNEIVPAVLKLLFSDSR